MVEPSNDRDWWQRYETARQNAAKPYQDDVHFAQRAIVDYGIFTIKSAFVLNGGALVLLPVYLRGPSTLPAASMSGSIFLAAVLFVSGLIAAAIASAAAYYSVVFLQMLSGYERNVQMLRTDDAFLGDVMKDRREAAETESERNELSIEYNQDRRKTYEARNLWAARAGVLATIAAFAFFVAGIWLATNELLT
jgi:hypothetical protein